MASETIIPPDLPQGKKYHVFLAHAGEDGDVALQIKAELSEAKFQVMTFKEDFTPGSTYLEETIAKVEQSMRMVVLLTPTFLKKNWPMYEAQQGITQMLHGNERYVIVLRYGLESRDVPKFLRWVTSIDYNNPQRNAMLQYAITDSTPLEIGLQGNDVGFGMAWGYFYSYLNVIVPPQGPDQLDLKGRIEKHLATRDNQDITYMPRKMYILVPESGILPSNIANVDNRITTRDPANDKMKTVVIRGGSERPYWNTIRTIDDGAQKFQFLVEYATVIQPLKEMEDNPKLVSFTADDRFDQVKSFYKTLENIIQESFTPEQQRMVELIQVRDQDENPLPLADILLQRIKQDMSQ
ncbi:unnamed protein product [Owenia fusiformis]|uniref:Uncharacterized protein n=1 Tax=Owenia fusiformis TaxID=6347 RepID=A0A8J1UL92_OWEFU|nr:unnamed protein product [Owenia fusiformis]